MIAESLFEVLYSQQESGFKGALPLSCAELLQEVPHSFAREQMRL